MMTFDTASRDFCEVKRQKTNTPLQALVLLNDPQYIESARLLATHILKSDSVSQEERTQLLFRTITSRYADEDEIDKMIVYLEESEAGMNQPDKNPEELLSIGQTPLDHSVDKNELYKYTTLACVLFNLEETIIKS